MLNVNEQLERIVEVAVVLLVGAMISTGYWSLAGPADRGAAVLRDPAPFGMAGNLVGEADGHGAAAPAGVVRHPRHRFGVLRRVRRQHDIRYRRRRGADVLRFHRDRRLDRRARDFSDSPDGAVPATARAGAGAEDTARCRTNDDRAPCHSHVIPGSMPLAMRRLRISHFSANDLHGGSTMDWDRISGNWAWWRERIQERWCRLTAMSSIVIAGRREQLVGRIQKVYGHRAARGGTTAAQLGTQPGRGRVRRDGPGARRRRRTYTGINGRG